MEKVTILLSTYNGEKYLESLLNSLYLQKYVSIDILVRDDGSTDKTLEILEKNKIDGKLSWYSGVNLKPAMSFMNLVKSAPKTQWYAFCDQDDVWDSEKLHIAISKLKKLPSEKPALYYGHPRIVDSNLKPIKARKSTYDKMLDFYSMLINSNATGCTMVFNSALLELIKREQPSYISMHDGWFHKVCIISKGNIIYDDDVPIYYRQHDNNVIGSTNSIFKILKQKIQSLKDKECIRSRTLKSLLDCYSDLMTGEEIEILKKICNYRDNLLNRLLLATDSRIKTDNMIRNMMFRLAVLFGVY